MEIEVGVGDWIRSKDGFIGKVRKISYDNMEKCNYYICEKDNVMASNYLENMAKHSKNIIDLVEVGDYVNGHRVTESKYKQYDKYYFIDIDCNDISFGWGIGVIPADEIKSIVTHEQFESVEYKVEED